MTLFPLLAPFPGSSVFVLPLYQYVLWTVPEQTNSVETDKKTFGTGRQEWEVPESEKVTKRKRDRMCFFFFHHLTFFIREEGGETMKVREWKRTRRGHGGGKQRGLWGEVARDKVASLHTMAAPRQMESFAERACLCVCFSRREETHFWEIGGFIMQGFHPAPKRWFNRQANYPQRP